MRVGMRIKVASIIGIALLSLSAHVGATTVVVLVNADSILIGADSLRSSGDTVCKIGLEGTTHFTFAGVVDGAVTKFSLVSTITKAIASQKTIAEQIKALDALMLPILESEAEYVRLNQRSEAFMYAAAQVNAPFAEVVLVGVDNGKPTAAHRVYTLGPKRITRDCPAATDTFFLGQIGAISKHLSKTGGAQKFFSERTDQAAIRELIEVEIAASLMGLPQEEVRAALLKQAPEPKELSRPVVFSRTAATQRTVVVEYKRASRR